MNQHTSKYNKKAQNVNQSRRQVLRPILLLFLMCGTLVCFHSFHNHNLPQIIVPPPHAHLEQLPKTNSSTTYRQSPTTNGSSISPQLRNSLPSWNNSSGLRHRPRGKIIYFLHIHKSGGTTLCTIAHLNQIRVDYQHNCNVQDDQRCCGFSDTLQAQERFAAVTFYEFVANEMDMYEAMDHQHYVYLVVLRTSQDRYLSHWKHMCHEQRPPVNNNQTTLLPLPPLPTFDKWWSAQPDNWNFRKLCGTRCQTVSKFRTTRELFDYTFHRLQSFDHILLLEHWDQMLPQFGQSMQWRGIPKLQMRVNKANLTYPELGRDWDPFMSVLDDALYEYGLARFQGIEKDFAFSTEIKGMLEQYFIRGRQRNCANPCCADECSAY